MKARSLYEFWNRSDIRSVCSPQHAFRQQQQQCVCRADYIKHITSGLQSAAWVAPTNQYPPSGSSQREHTQPLWWWGSDPVVTCCCSRIIYTHVKSAFCSARVMHRDSDGELYRTVGPTGSHGISHVALWIAPKCGQRHAARCRRQPLPNAPHLDVTIRIHTKWKAKPQFCKGGWQIMNFSTERKYPNI